MTRATAAERDALRVGDRVARKLALSRGQAGAAALDDLATLVGALEDSSLIEIRGLGSLSVRGYGAYVGRDPRTGPARGAAETIGSVQTWQGARGACESSPGRLKACSPV